MIILMRHATTEGGDGHLIADEGLSSVGQEEARELAGRFKDMSITNVYSSRYQRCKETAGLVFGGSTTWEPLDTFAGLDGTTRYERNTRVLARINSQVDSVDLVLMTHRRNIYWLIDKELKPGEFIVYEASSHRIG